MKIDTQGWVGGDFEKTLASVKTLIYGVFVALEIDVNVVIVLSYLMLADTIVGVIKAVRLGETISFKKLIWGMVTKVSVLIVPMVLALVAKGLSFDFKWFVNAVLDILVVAEGFSVISNVIAIKEKKEVENSDIITKLLNAVRKGMARIINGLMNTIDPEEDNKKQ